MSQTFVSHFTISGSYSASVTERLHCAVLQKRGGKVVLLLYGNAPVDKCNIVQNTIEKGGFAELNHPAYSSDIAPPDCYLFSNLKKFIRGKNVSHDKETI